MNPLLLGLILWKGVPLIKGGSTASQLEFYPKNLDYDAGKFYYRMDILNPTRNELTVDTFFGGLYVGDEKVGSIEYNKPIVLKKSQRTEVRIPIIPTGLGLGKVIAKIIKGDTKNLTFRVVGVARALGINNPVNEEIKLS